MKISRNNKSIKITIKEILEISKSIDKREETKLSKTSNLVDYDTLYDMVLWSRS